MSLLSLYITDPSLAFVTSPRYNLDHIASGEGQVPFSLSPIIVKCSHHLCIEDRKTWSIYVHAMLNIIRHTEILKQYIVRPFSSSVPLCYEEWLERGRHVIPHKSMYLLNINWRTIS